MRFWYVARRDKPTFDSGMLAAFWVALLLILLWLLPRENTFTSMLDTDSSDSVSLAYARFLTSLRPDEDHYKVLLARQYLNLGQLFDAEKVISSLSAGYDPETELARAEVLQRLLFSSLDTRNNDNYRARLLATLSRLQTVPLDERETDTFAKIALAFNQPRIAAMQLERLIDVRVDVESVMAAAAAWLAASEPKRAGDLYARAVPMAGASALHDALRAYQAAGAYDSGLTLLSTWFKANPADPDVLVTALAFARAAGNDAAATRYVRQLAATPLHGQQLEDALNASIAMGLLDIAVVLARQQLAFADNFAPNFTTKDAPDNVVARERLARLYEWTGQPELALPIYQWLAVNTDNPRHRSTTLTLAGQLYRFEVIAKVLSNQSQKRPLSADELATWISAFVDQGLSNLAVSALHRYLVQHPKDRKAWVQLANTQANNLDLADSVHTYSEIESRFGLSEPERLMMARMQQSLFALEDALQTLQGNGDVEAITDAGLLNLLAEVAWYLDERDLVKRSYLRIRQLAIRKNNGASGAATGALTPFSVPRLLASLNTSERKLAFQIAKDAWEEHAQHSFLVAALFNALELRDLNSAAQLLASVTDSTVLSNDKYFLQLRAWYLQLAGDLDGAARDLAAALKLAPADRSLVVASIWLGIERRDTRGLRAMLLRWMQKAANDSVFWSAYGAGYAALGNHRASLAWYRRAATASPRDEPLLFSYADALARAGYLDPALRLRRYLIQQVLARGFGKSAEPQAFSRLDSLRLAEAFDLLTYPQREWLVRRTVAQSANGFDTPRWRFVQALERNHLDLAISLASESVNAAATPASVRLEFAALTGDATTLEQLLNDPDPGIRAQAALGLNETELALATALAHMESPATGYRSDLAALAGSLHARYPSAWRLTQESFSSGGVDIVGPQFSYAGWLQDHHIQIDASAHRINSSLASFDNETLVNLHLRPASEYRDWKLSLAPRQVGNSTHLGVSGGARWPLGSGLALTLDTDWNTVTTASPLLRAAGSADRLSAGLSASLDRWNQFSARTSIHRYVDLERNMVATGFSTELRHVHTLLRGLPTLEFTSSAYFAQHALEAADRFDSRLSLGGELVPEERGLVLFGVSLRHGDVGELGWPGPSPRFHADIGAGLQWPDVQPTFNVSLGMGLAVLGSDEFSVDYQYVSLPLAGSNDPGHVLKLSYSYRIGR